jgi:hypothetical protein
MKALVLQDIPFFHVELAYCPHPSRLRSLRMSGSEASSDRAPGQIADPLTCGDLRMPRRMINTLPPITSA